MGFYSDNLRKDRIVCYTVLKSNRLEDLPHIFTVPGCKSPRAELTECAPAAQLSLTGQQKDCNIHRSLKISDIGDKGSVSISITHEVNGLISEFLNYNF